MKYVFGIDITEDRNNNEIEGQVFHSNSTLPILKENYDRCASVTEKIEKEASLPIGLKIIKELSLAIVCFLLFGIIGSLKKVNLKQAYANAPVLFYVVALFSVIGLILYLVEKYRKKNQNRDEVNYKDNYIKNIYKSAKEILNIPEEAIVVEVLMFYYIIKKGKMKVIEKISNVGAGFIYYQNFQVYAYIKNESLHMADLYNEWCIPLSCILGIRTINKKIYVPCWKKEIPYNKDKYKKYKMIQNYYGNIFFKPYYAFRIAWQGEEYELFIPPYERGVLTSLVGFGGETMLP